jgi:serine/threonine-protein kinase
MEAATPTKTDPLRGTPFRALASLGQGGMGSVWRAESVRTGQQVAVKVLHDHLQADLDSLERFRTEAEVARLLDHPNVVRVLELAMPPAVERPYYAMELLTGESLVDRLHRAGTLPVLEAIEIAHQLLDALGAVHAAGIVHRDIKPGNVFLCGDDRVFTVKLIDFGIAKVLPLAQHPEDPRGLTPRTLPTREGAFVGTALYASPEQAVGDVVDRRADLYAVGHVLYNMLTGRSPFGRERGTTALLRMQTGRMPDPPSKRAKAPIPPELDDLVMAALAKRREERFASAEQFAEALEEIAARLRAPTGWLRTHVFDASMASKLDTREPLPPPPARAAVEPREGSESLPAATSARSSKRVMLPFVLVSLGMGVLVSLLMLLVWRAWS